MSVQARTITEDRSHTGSRVDCGDGAYLIPPQRCASCGLPTRTDGGIGPRHLDCRRDASGRLLVVDGGTL